MAKRSKLLMALDAHQGRDYKVEKQKKLQRQAVKRKSSRMQAPIFAKEDAKAFVNGSTAPVDNDCEACKSDKSELSENAAICTVDVFGSESDSESNSDGKGTRRSGPGQVEGEDGIPLSDIDSLASEDKADILPHQRLTINNTSALLNALKSIALPSSLPFTANQITVTPEPIAISDVNDDLTRELAFYRQCLDSAIEARRLTINEGVPFSRPTDYFAEMVKSDEHMGKVKQKMLDEAANNRAAADARKQRDLRRFGKQVQVTKVQERGKAKRDTLNKIDLLKRKRKNTDNHAAHEEDLFDVALAEAAQEGPLTKSLGNGLSYGRGAQNKRQKKNAKFGFGGRKRFSKSGDAVSSADLAGSSVKRTSQKKGAKRLGKSRRNN